MTQRAWIQVVDDPAARHLVAALMDPKAADEPAALMATLIEGLAPVGDFALVTRCEAEGPVMLCAFSHPSDANALAAAVGATETDAYSEWASRRCFALDRPTAKAIADAIEVSNVAPPARQRPAPPRVVPAPAYRRAA
jgi:hypothetical protein